MEKAEVIDLVIELKKNFPNMDASPEEIERYYRALRDFPYDAAAENVRQYILTERFPPKIADIRGGLGEQMDRKQSRDDAAAFMAQLDEFAASAAPPPPGNLEKVRAMLLRGATNE